MDANRCPEFKTAEKLIITEMMMEQLKEARER